MALTMENKFARIKLDKLPADLRKEAEMIRDETENFSDPELVEIFEDNFKELYEIIEKKAPGALQLGKPLKKVPVAKRKAPVPKPVKKPEHFDFQVGDMVFYIAKEGEYFDKSYPAWRVLSKTDKSVEIENLDTSERIHTDRKNISVILPPEGKRKSMADVKLDECKKILREADYDISKRLVKGKRRITRKKRPDKTIIKDNAKRLVGTTKEDIKPTYPRAEKWKKEVDEIGGLFGKLAQKVDNIVHQDRDMVKLLKIKALLKELVD